MHSQEKLGNSRSMCALFPLLAENDTMALISCSNTCCSSQAMWGHPGPGPQLWPTHIMPLQPKAGLGCSFLCHPQNGSLKYWWRILNFLLDPRMLNCYKWFFSGPSGPGDRWRMISRVWYQCNTHNKYSALPHFMGSSTLREVFSIWHQHLEGNTFSRHTTRTCYLCTVPFFSGISNWINPFFHVLTIACNPTWCSIQFNLKRLLKALPIQDWRSPKMELLQLVLVLFLLFHHASYGKKILPWNPSLTHPSGGLSLFVPFSQVAWRDKLHFHDGHRTRTKMALKYNSEVV